MINTKKVLLELFIAISLMIFVGKGASDDSHDSDHRVTVVSAYYRLPSKHSYGDYESWISNYMRMKFSSIIYCDMNTRSYLARRWSPTKHRRYIVRPIDSFVTSSFNWTNDLHRDSERVLGHNIRLYKLWNEKIFMVQHAMKLNPYNTSCFAWTDIGSFRERTELVKYTGFPDTRTFRHHKVSFLMVQDFRKKETLNLSRIDERFMYKARIGGGVFIGGTTALRKFAQLHLRTIREAKSINVFAGKDQSLFAFEILRHPELFDLIRPLPEVYDLWFSLHLQFSSKMAGKFGHIEHPTVTFKS